MNNPADMIMKMVKQKREIEFLKSNQIGLGNLITQTEEIVKNIPSEENSTWLSFEFGSLGVTCMDSYRGYYDELALGYGDDGVSIREFLKILKNALGKVYTGYKGGDYEMHKDTPIWAANYGRTGYTKVIGIEKENDYTFIIRTIQDYND